MADDTVNGILKDYDTRKGLLDQLKAKIEALIPELLKGEGINPHRVSARVKDRESLEKKLFRPHSPCKKLDDVPDVIGVRIITYFEDDVEPIAKLIESEFDVDDDQSENKADLLDPDRFGYLSRHYEISLSENRTKLPEWKAFKGYQIEIQIRSILQHAWAEIEHDLGYKSKEGIPRIIRRRFSRLAGLLELADDEFKGIRDELQAYTEDIGLRIEDAPGTVLIDMISLTKYIDTSARVLELNKQISNTTRLPLHDWINGEDAQELISSLAKAGFQTLEELDTGLADLGDTIVKAERICRSYPEDRTTGFLKGRVLFSLAAATVITKGGLADLMRYHDDSCPTDDIERMFRAYEQAGLPVGPPAKEE